MDKSQHFYIIKKWKFEKFCILAQICGQFVKLLNTFLKLYEWFPFHLGALKKPIRVWNGYSKVGQMPFVWARCSRVYSEEYGDVIFLKTMLLTSYVDNPYALICCFTKHFSVKYITYNINIHMYVFALRACSIHIIIDGVYK